MASTPLRLWTLTARPCLCASNPTLAFAFAHKSASRVSPFFVKSFNRSVGSGSQSTWASGAAASVWRAWRPPSGVSLHEYFISSLRSRAGTYRSRSTPGASTSWRGRLLRSPGDPPPPQPLPGSGSGGGGRGPLKGLRRWFNLRPPELLVWTIIGLNAGIYFAWQYAWDQAKLGRFDTAKWMLENVQVSWKNIREGRFWTLITAAFSHDTAGHILLNCMSFYGFAPAVMSLIGNSAFLSLYFFGGIVCSLTSLYFNSTVRHGEGRSHGASGAIFAVSSFYACCFPRTNFLLFFVVPCPAWLVITGLFLYDGISALTDRQRQIDGAGHVGGIIAGVAYYVVKRRLLF